MYVFAMMALLGLAVLGVTAIASRYLAVSAEIRAFALAALGAHWHGGGAYQDERGRAGHGLCVWRGCSQPAKMTAHIIEARSG